jgi:exopolysaccharide biosynthesis polyprenyl glycosylphosphotransferase
MQPEHSISPAVYAWSAGGTVVYLWLLMLMRCYEVKNLYRMNHALKSLIKAAALWVIGLWACVGLFAIQGFSPRIGAFYCAMSLVAGLGFWRLVAFTYIVSPKVKRAASARTIVIGWTTQAEHLRESIRTDIGQLAEIIGCVPMPGGRFAEQPPADVAVLGDYSALPEIVKECNATSIILADVSCSSAEIQYLISFCQRELLTFQLVPQYFPTLYSGLQVQTVSGVPLLGVHHLPLERTFNRFVKRTIDIVGALIGLSVSALIVPFFALIVYIESPGPVIFRQRRTSRSGRDFYIYKIRSMKLNAESGTGAVWCKQEDPRRLKIGSFMRKTNVDELPQFWNVLKGDMSLVGPRPERPELIEKFKYEIPNYNVRHEARAGLTGWAQINGLRGDTDLTKRIEADIYYLENWSPLLDIYCIFATVFKTKNAY